jgi:hypothetical protein
MHRLILSALAIVLLAALRLGPGFRGISHSGVIDTSYWCPCARGFREEALGREERNPSPQDQQGFESQRRGHSQMDSARSLPFLRSPKSRFLLLRPRLEAESAQGYAGPDYSPGFAEADTPSFFSRSRA